MSVQPDESSFPEDPNDVTELLIYEQEMSDVPTAEGVDADPDALPEEPEPGF